MLDSDELLSYVATKLLQRNTPGTRYLVWQQIDNVPKRFNF